MTASMILWTFEMLDWVREQLAQAWPGAKLRGGAPDIAPEPYRIRFRDDGKQYWMVLSPDTIRETRVADVASLLSGADWINTMKMTGGISVDVQQSTGTRPVLLPWPEPGPEVMGDHHHH